MDQMAGIMPTLCNKKSTFDSAKHQERSYSAPPDTSKELTYKFVLCSHDNDNFLGHALDGQVNIESHPMSSELPSTFKASFHWSDINASLTCNYNQQSCNFTHFKIERDISMHSFKLNGLKIVIGYYWSEKDDTIRYAFHSDAHNI